MFWSYGVASNPLGMIIVSNGPLPGHFDRIQAILGVLAYAAAALMLVFCPANSDTPFSVFAASMAAALVVQVVGIALARKLDCIELIGE